MTASLLNEGPAGASTPPPRLSARWDVTSGRKPARIRTPSMGTVPIQRFFDVTASGYTTRTLPDIDKFTALFEVWRDSHDEDWRADGSLPVSLAALLTARSFLSVLPGRLPAPGIRPSVAGEITFNWQTAPDEVFTVSFGERPEVLFAGLHGGERFYGRVPFDGLTPPPRIIKELGRFRAPDR